MERPTADVDFLEVVPPGQTKLISTVAGKDSPLHRKLHVYLDPHARVANLPDSYTDRVTEIFPGCYKHLVLWALDPYDLALSKLERNSGRDRDDVKYLARKIPLDPEILRERYNTEMRPYLVGREGWHDGALAVWIEMIKEVRGI